MRYRYPFSAIVGQDEMRDALLLSAVDPLLGGVLVVGDRGTGKSTAIRALAGLLPEMQVVAGCPYNCESAQSCLMKEGTCPACDGPDMAVTETRSVPVIDMPLGATEDRIVGALDLERALTQGVKAFEPGLLARADRGYLYIDEVNLLEDHLVDLLLDVAATGENIVEREGLSIRHPARFVLVGSGNPEEGDLRPQLLDRFGLCVEVSTPSDVPARIEIIRRRDAFERAPEEFCKTWHGADLALRDRIVQARQRLDGIDVPRQVLEHAAALCIALKTDGLRGELTLLKAARALAALDGDDAVADSHVRRVAAMALRHRLRRDPLDEAGSTVRVERALSDLFTPRLERRAG